MRRATVHGLAGMLAVRATQRHMVEKCVAQRGAQFANHAREISEAVTAPTLISQQ